MLDFAKRYWKKNAKKQFKINQSLVPKFLSKYVLFAFVVVLNLICCLTPACASDFNATFYLTDSNAMPDGPLYATVQMIGQMTLGKVTIIVTPIDLTPGGNFGVQEFGFNTLLTLAGSNFSLPAGWSAGFNQQLDMMGIFDVDTVGTGGTRQNPLTFSLVNLDPDDVALANVYQMNSFKKHFSTHIAGYQAVNGITSAFFGDNLGGNTSLNAIFDATGIPSLGTGVQVIPGITTYGTLNEANFMSEVDGNGHVTFQYFKEEEFFRVVNQQADGYAVNTAGIRIQLTQSGLQLIQSLSSPGEKIQFFMTKEGQPEIQLEFGSEWDIEFDANRIAYLHPTLSFFDNNPDYSLESDFDDPVGYAFRVVFPEADVTFDTDNPYDVGTAVLGNDQGIIDPDAQIVPEMPAWFFGIFALLMSGLILRLRNKLLPTA